MIPPGLAFVIIVAGAFAGPFIAGTAVALTIGLGIVDYRVVGVVPLIGAMAGGTMVLLLAYAVRVPVSASVALVSAMIGSLVVVHRLDQLAWSGVAKVGFSLIASIIVGFVGGAAVYTAAVLLLRGVSFQTGQRIMKLQYLTVALQAVGYGANDAEKMMGLIVAATLVGSSGSSISMPVWVIALSIGAFAVGTAFGGPRVARTVGGKLFRIRPLHALSFQLAAATTVLGASALGGPLSTTETTASAILGVGASSNPWEVRWTVARDLITAWLLTAPIGFATGMLATAVIHPFLHGAR